MTGLSRCYIFLHNKPVVTHSPRHLEPLRPIFYESLSNQAYCLVGIAGTTILIPCHIMKSLQLIWRSGTHRWNLWVPDLQTSCCDMTEIFSTNLSFYFWSSTNQWLGARLQYLLPLSNQDTSLALAQWYTFFLMFNKTINRKPSLMKTGCMTSV